MPTRLAPEPAAALANIVHGTSAANAKTGYGTPPVGTLAILLNSSVKMPISTG